MTESRKRTVRHSKVERDDAPELTKKWFAGADLYAGNKLVRRGRPPGTGKRVLISLRLDREAIAAYRATGTNWQTRLNELVVRSAKRLRTSGG